MKPQIRWCHIKPLIPCDSESCEDCVHFLNEKALEKLEMAGRRADYIILFDTTRPHLKYSLNLN